MALSVQAGGGATSQTAETVQVRDDKDTQHRGGERRRSDSEILISYSLDSQEGFQKSPPPTSHPGPCEGVYRGPSTGQRAKMRITDLGRKEQNVYRQHSSRKEDIEAARETGNRAEATDASNWADTKGSKQGLGTRQERFGLYTAAEISLVPLTWALTKGEEGEFYILCFSPQLKIFKSIPIFLKKII